MLMALFGPRGAAFSSFTSRQVWFVIYSLVFCSFLIEPFCGVSLRVHLRLHSCNESHKLMIRFILFLCFAFALVLCEGTQIPSAELAVRRGRPCLMLTRWPSIWTQISFFSFFLKLHVLPECLPAALVTGWSDDLWTKNSPRTWHSPGVWHEKNIGCWRCDRTSPKQV